MRFSLRLYAGLILLSALLVAIGVLATRVSDDEPLPPLPGESKVSDDESLPPLPGESKVSDDESLPPRPGEPEVNLIAYVGLDAQVHTIRPDGLDERRVSPQGGRFTWPTWAPDAQGLLFSGVVSDGAGNPKISLYAFDAASGRAHEIYIGDPGLQAFLAEGVVHYPLWSPDSTRVAFVVVTESHGLTLFLDDLKEDADAEFVLGRGPLWISWSPDSRYLLVHRSHDHFLVNTVDGVRVNQLEFQSPFYRVPAWSPSGDAVTISSGFGPDNHTLYSAQVVGDGIDVPLPIAVTTSFPAFRWSPDGATLAVADSTILTGVRGLATMVYGELTLLSQDGTREAIEVREGLIAYFWSPDGTELAYVTLADTAGVLRWMVLDVAEGTRWPLVDFEPSPDQMTMFQFFDQYGYSHSLWSPDSKSLVFAGALKGEPVSASFGATSGAQSFHIIVVNADRNPSPERIADGIQAFWSPR